jgi:catechol 2,3-dioxygenase-like lactoylglutathione lyase family enzyme
MLTHFPQAVPEIPVSNVDQAAEYYVNVLGFTFEWGNDEGGIGGLQPGNDRGGEAMMLGSISPATGTRLDAPQVA